MSDAQLIYSAIKALNTTLQIVGWIIGISIAFWGGVGALSLMRVARALERKQ